MFIRIRRSRILSLKFADTLGLDYNDKIDNKGELEKEFISLKKVMMTRKKYYTKELQNRISDIKTEEKSIENITKYPKKWKTLQNRITFLSRLRCLVIEGRMYGLKRHKSKIMRNNTVYHSKRKFRFVIFPNSFLYQLHMTVMLLLVGYIMLILPVHIGFLDEAFKTNFWKNLDLFAYFYFAFDILVNFFLSYEIDHQPVTKNRKIALHYLSGWFWVDILSIFPFELFLGFAERNTVLIRSMKIPRFIRAFVIFKEFGNKNQKAKFKTWNSLRRYFEFNKGLSHLIRISLITFVFTHIATCLWNFFSLSSGTEEQNWLNK